MIEDRPAGNPRVLITYAWVRSSWAIMRNLARHGLTVHVGDHQRVFMSRYSRYCSGWFQYPHFKTDPLDFVDCIAEYVTKHDIGTYIPSHEEGFVVAKYRDRLPGNLRLPISPYATIHRLNNKRLAQELATDLGVPHPVTFSFNSRDDFRRRIAEMPARGVIKHVDSHGSHGVRFYDTKAELIEAWEFMCDLLQAEGELPIVQEFVDGRIYACSILAYRGKVKASFVRRNLREKETFGGACVKCDSVQFPELVHLSTSIVAAVDYTGVAMFEFLVKKDTNEPSLMEINPRYWGTTAHDIDCGVHFPYLHYCVANGIPLPAENDYPVGFISRWIVGDIISWINHRRLRRRSSITFTELLGIDRNNKMDFKIDDPLPFLVQTYLYFKFRRQILG